jgi:hypothetical protein
MLKLIVDFGTMMIGVYGVRLLLRKRVKEGPHRCKAPRSVPNSPRKANASHSINRQFNGAEK